MSYYKAKEIIENILLSHPDVNTVVHGRTSDKDLYKKNIYPLCHIVPQGALFNSPQVMEFTFQVAAIDQRLTSNFPEKDKLNDDNNQVDNLDAMFNVINFLMTKLAMQYNDDLELTASGAATPILFKENNLMDGWYINITVSLPNDLINVCD